jgi:Fic family protein
MLHNPLMAHIWQSPLWPKFIHDPHRTEAALAAFALRLGRVVGLQDALSAEERSEAFLKSVTREAVASFGIEGVTLSAEDVEASVVASLAHRDQEPIRRTDAVAALMLDARDGGGPLTEARLHSWHALLFHGIELEEKAMWRSFEMVIVKSAKAGREEVLYTAPPPDQVAGDMATFLKWLNEEDQLPTPVRAALAHLWFESIHPYSDGNGRVGRAIVEHVFATDTALPFSFSRQIQADKRGYYAALQAGRQLGAGGIDGTDFVEWFLGRLYSGMDEAESDARFLVGRNRFFLRFSQLSPRANKVLRRLFADGPDRVAQGLSAGPYSKIASVSPATATRDLIEMEAMGALLRGPEGGRATRYLLAL